LNTIVSYSKPVRVGNAIDTDVDVCELEGGTFGTLLIGVDVRNTGCNGRNVVVVVVIVVVVADVGRVPAKTCLK
jgi:hypothetical protein